MKELSGPSPCLTEENLVMSYRSSGGKCPASRPLIILTELENKVSPKQKQKERQCRKFMKASS
jgi:hypothetical protein